MVDWRFKGTLFAINTHVLDNRLPVKSVGGVADGAWRFQRVLTTPSPQTGDDDSV
jgi:hypothetical protein